MEGYDAFIGRFMQQRPVLSQSSIHLDEYKLYNMFLGRNKINNKKERTPYTTPYTTQANVLSCTFADLSLTDFNIPNNRSRDHNTDATGLPD